MTAAARYHAHFAAQTPARTASISRKGHTYEVAEFACRSVAYRVDGGNWSDYWSVDQCIAHDLKCALEA